MPSPEASPMWMPEPSLPANYYVSGEGLDIPTNLNPNTPPMDPLRALGYEVETAARNRDAGRGRLRDLYTRPLPQAPQEQLPSFGTKDIATAGIPALLLSLFGRGKDAADYLQGFASGKFSRADLSNRAAQLGYQQQLQQLQRDQDLARMDLGFANDDYGDAVNQLATRMKADRTAEEERARQEGMNYRSRLKSDANALNQAIKAVSLRHDVGREAAIDILFDQGFIDDELYSRLRPQVARRTTEEQKGAAQIKQIEANAALAWARADELRTLGPEKLNKLKAEIDSLKARTGLTGMQAELLDKRIANFDAEFKLRAANIYSQIENRAASGTVDPRKAEDQEVKDLKGLISISEAQLAKLPAPSGVLGVDQNSVRRSMLQDQIKKASERIEAIASARAATPNDPTMPPKELPPGKIGEVRIPTPKPKKGKAGNKPLTPKLPAGWSID